MGHRLNDIRERTYIYNDASRLVVKHFSVLTYFGLCNPTFSERSPLFLCRERSALRHRGNIRKRRHRGQSRRRSLLGRRLIAALPPPLEAWMNHTPESLNGSALEKCRIQLRTSDRAKRAVLAQPVQHTQSKVEHNGNRRNAGSGMWTLGDKFFLPFFHSRHCQDEEGLFILRE